MTGTNRRETHTKRWVCRRRKFLVALFFPALKKKKKKERGKRKNKIQACEEQRIK